MALPKLEIGHDSDAWIEWQYILFLSHLNIIELTNIVHMIDDIFWLMGLQTEKQAEKVIIYNICITYIIVIVIIILTGSYRARSCGSHVAEQTRCYYPVCA